MKTLYIDCSMGAAGDMLTAALLEITEDSTRYVRELNALGIPHVRYTETKSEKCGIVGTHVSVTIDGVEEHEHVHEHTHVHECEHGHGHEHAHDGGHVHTHEHAHDGEHAHMHDGEHAHIHEHVHDEEHAHTHEHAHVHRSMHDVENIINGLAVSDSVKRHALAVYNLIAEAESHAHGKPVSEIHFHEVGTMDAIADVVAVCYLMEKIAPEHIVASPIHVGSGHVHCAHGTLPVPAPATAYILKDVPIYGGAVTGELCTPTGAALLKHFVDAYGSIPAMRTAAVGYGMGKRDYEQANCVRILLGTSVQKETDSMYADKDAHADVNADVHADSHADTYTNTVTELCCNLDDMTPEAIGYAMEQLFYGGALDVFTTPVGMKKMRPATMLTVLCEEKDRDAILRIIFLHTTTLGVRENICKRYTLERQIVTEQTAYGAVRKKTATGYGVTREKYEYDDLAKIASAQGLSLEDVKKGL